jgi:hypothetical protein
MAASDHLSPAQLRAHVQQHLDDRYGYAEWPQHYATPKCAEGECGEASEEYATKAIKDGHNVVLHTYVMPDNVHQRHFKTHVFSGHTVAIVQTSRGPYIVDLTHRQYDEKAPYPLVEPRHKFLKRKSMKPFRTYDVEKKENTPNSFWFTESSDNPIEGRD